MRGLAAVYCFLAASTVAHAAPSDTLYIPDRVTEHGFFGAAFGSLRRSLEPALQFVIKWLPSVVPAPSVDNGWVRDENVSDMGTGSILESGQTIACTNPSVRKEWRSMSVDEREAWISAILCLTKLPSSGKMNSTVRPHDPLNANPPVNHSASWYDDISYVHIDLNTHIHQTGFFFPWHRYFLWSFEQTLKNQCGYSGTLPYWDWTQDAHNFKNSTIFDSDHKSGLGSFGDPSNDHAVYDGAFAGMQLAYPSPHVLRREYTPYPYRNRSMLFFKDQELSAASTFTPDKVEKITGGFRGDFKAFQTHLEHMQGPHMSVHFIVGGDLGGSCPKNAPRGCVPGDAKWSPNEPMFWLHHGMLDKLWSDWQLAHPENYWSFEAGTLRELTTWPKYPTGAPPAMTPNVPLPTNGLLVGNYTVGDMFNMTSKAPLCYRYA